MLVYGLCLLQIARLLALRRWGVFRVDLEGDGEEERLTPPDQDVFTPATSPGQGWIAVAMPDEDGFRCCLAVPAATSCAALPRTTVLGQLCTTNAANSAVIGGSWTPVQQGANVELGLPCFGHASLHKAAALSRLLAVVACCAGATPPPLKFTPPAACTCCSFALALPSKRCKVTRWFKHLVLLCSRTVNAPCCDIAGRSRRCTRTRPAAGGV